MLDNVFDKMGLTAGANIVVVAMEEGDRLVSCALVPSEEPSAEVSEPSGGGPSS